MPNPSGPWLLVLCHEFPPRSGGAGRNLALLCRELTRRGINLEVWTADAENVREHFSVRGFAVRRDKIFETSPLKAWTFVRGALREGKAMTRAPRVLFSCMGLPAGLAGARLSRHWGIPHYVWYQGSDAHGGKAGGPGWFLRLYLRWLFRNSGGSFFVSRDLRGLAESAGVAPSPRILTTVPSPEIRNVPPRRHPGYFLWAGRLETVKDPLLPVKAWQGLHRRGEQPPLRMAGEGVLEPGVRSGLRNIGLDLEDPIPAAGMAQAMDGAIAVILTSRVEGFSTLLLEAGCRGVPAIACDVPGVRQFVRDGANGLLVKAGDPAALGGAVLKLWKNPGWAESLGAQARKDSEVFTPEHSADVVLAAWSEDGVRPEPVLHGEQA